MANKRTKLSRAAWVFDVVLNLRQKEIPEQNLVRSMTLLQYLLSFVPTLDNLQSLQWA